MLSVLLLAAMVAITILHPAATRSFVTPDEQPLVERARRDAAAAFGETSQALARTTFPVVMQLSDRTCVELRPIRRNEGGYSVCYAAGTDQIIEERVRSAAFGG